MGAAMLSVDTETTGKDLFHGVKPFFVTTCNEDGEQIWWEWEVDPLTRIPIIPQSDLGQIGDLIFGPVGDDGPDLILQNAKFDVTALSNILPSFSWPWDRTFDTLLAGHLLASNHPHDLTSMAFEYLGVNIEELEKALESAVKEGRRMVQQAKLRDKRGKDGGELANWRIAEEGLPEMPSAKNSSNKKNDPLWKNDSWLPRALAKFLNLDKDHSWWTVLRDYANADSFITVNLWKVMRSEIERRGLWEIYDARRKILKVAHGMETRGVTVNGERLEKQISEYRETSIECEQICVNIAGSLDYDLSLPKSGNNKSLLEFAFNVLKLPVVKTTKTGNPSLDKEAMDEYLGTLPAGSKGRAFIESLIGKRKCDTAITYMEGYKRFWHPMTLGKRIVEGWFKLHPNLNPTGTDTLRWSSNNPNSQNVSKKEGFNLRYCFGPAPGREWWSMDGKNMELRFPAYESGEEAFIDLFEHPDDPPYFGSNHALVAHLMFPEEFESCVNDDGFIDGRIFKKRFPDKADRTKRGNFCHQYGGQERKTDHTFGVEGAQNRIKKQFKKQESLREHYVYLANRDGYVETIPDTTVNSQRGYPILSTRDEYGRIIPTKPFSHHIQSTVGWWMEKAMVRCDNYLSSEHPDCWIVMQVHDELVFDMPAGTGPEPWRTNLRIADQLRRLMEKGGDDLRGIPTPVSVEYHSEAYSDGISIDTEQELRNNESRTKGAFNRIDPRSRIPVKSKV